METSQTILVQAANGKTGRRVADRLERLGAPIRRGSRNAEIPFDWDDPTTWLPALKEVQAVYMVYTPDLAVSSAFEAIRSFTQLAVQTGVRRLVLLSGRGEEEARRCERIVQESGLEWTIVRASWFNQNFDEGEFLDLVLAGEIALPAGSAQEPFVDVEDIAEVAVAALTQEGHAGQVYELTGPRLMTFAQAVSEIADASGRNLRYADISVQEFSRSLSEAGLPQAHIQLLEYLFHNLLDGRNAHLCDGVRRALGKPPRDFRDYARKAAATGVWNPVEQTV
ncbi:MAG: NmrA family transcriptional regulator [Planctomycetota bacterium]|nr:MAG: NmrA family transcriptional regulator [Planctomycetota bacterium]